MESKTLTVKEVSKILNISESTVRELISQGKLKKLNINKPIRIPQSAIDELLGSDIPKQKINHSLDIVLKKEDVTALISSVISVQNMANQILTMLQDKLK